MGQDVIDLIKQDHREVEELHRMYKDHLHQGREAEADKVFNQIVWELCRHSVSEELVLYPVIASLGEKGQFLADKSREDHHQLKVLLQELLQTKDTKKFDEVMDEAYAAFAEHTKMEESEDLPYLAEHTDAATRETIARTFNIGKTLAPTRPHPGIPEKPVALEAALGLFLKPLDAFRDLFTPFPNPQPQ